MASTKKTEPKELFKANEIAYSIHGLNQSDIFAITNKFQKIEPLNKEGWVSLLEKEGYKVDITTMTLTK